MKAIKCQSCGSPDLDQQGPDQFKCLHCGTLLKTDENRTLVVLQHGWLCTACGSNNEDLALFCGRCGKKLAKFCAHCGKEAQRTTTFCQGCGSAAFLSLNNTKFKADSVFFIQGLGCMVIGKVEGGSPQKGDSIYIEQPGQIRKFSITKIEQNHREVQQVVQGEMAGFLLGGAARDEIKRGDVLVN